VGTIRTLDLTPRLTLDVTSIAAVRDSGFGCARMSPRPPMRPPSLGTWFRSITISSPSATTRSRTRREFERVCLLNRKIQGELCDLGPQRCVWRRKTRTGVGFFPKFPAAKIRAFSAAEQGGIREEQGIYGKIRESVFAAIRDRVSNLCKRGAND